MLDTDKMRNYLKWRNANAIISRDIGCPYIYLYRFTIGATNQPRLEHLNKLEAWIKSDVKEFNKLKM